MNLSIIVNTNEPESAWNSLRLGKEALDAGNEVSIFLLGSGVELTNINHETFDAPGVLKKFLDSGGNLLACGTCLELRHQEAGACSISTMSQLVELIDHSDKVVTFG